MPVRLPYTYILAMETKLGGTIFKTKRDALLSRCSPLKVSSRIVFARHHGIKPWPRQVLPTGMLLLLPICTWEKTPDRSGNFLGGLLQEKLSFFRYGGGRNLVHYHIIHQKCEDACPQQKTRKKST
jgi:hypothetical protein